MAFCEASVTLVAGESANLTMRVLPGTARHIMFEPSDGLEELEVEVLDATGRPIPTPMSRFGAQAVIHGLGKGSWRVVARTGDGRAGELEFTIDSLEPNDELLRIALR